MKLKKARVCADKPVVSRSHRDLRLNRLITAPISLCLLLAAFAYPAEAATPISLKGKIYGCVGSKGKGKGFLRVVQKRAKCKRSERRVAWSIAGPPGNLGTAAPQGSAGVPGGNGTPGPAGLQRPGVQNLEGVVEKQTLRIDALSKDLLSTQAALQSTEAILQGVTRTDLVATIENATKLSTI